MPTETARVGPNTIPAASGGLNSKVKDLTLDGLLDFVGFLVKQALDTKTAEMGGPATSAPVFDACPTANRFPWNHSGTFVRPHPSSSSTAAPLPGLWAWRVSSTPSETHATILEDMLESEVRIDYVFQACSIPDGFDGRSGLQAIVAGQVARYLNSRGTRHPSYGYGADADGVPLFRSLNLAEVRMLSATHRMHAVTPEARTIAANVGHNLRFMPAVEFTLRVIEPLENVQESLPGDLLNDSALIIDVGPQPGDVIEFGRGTLVRPIDLFDHDP